MRAAILRAKSRERRYAIAAFLVLVFVIGSHALLETARDALFLSKVSASKLPWLYIVIAFASVVVTQLGARVRVGGAQSLTLTVAATAVATLALGWVVPRFPIAGAYVLYIWTGVLIAVVLMRFWVLISGLFTVTQAKALYGFVGTGSVVGAIAGSGAARALAEVLPASQLVFAGGVSLGLGAAVSLFFWREGATAADVDDERNASLTESIRLVSTQPYARVVAVLIGLSAMALTLVDYLFKSIVAERVPPEELGAFFATVYLALNIGSLLVQVVLVGWIVQRFNVLGALAVLPALVFVGSVGLVLLPASVGLALALGMKGVDGIMRHTLNRTATELLFVLLSGSARQRLKLFTDLVSQKGGQALVSMLILALGAVGGLFVLPWLLVGLVGLWIVTLMATRRPYLSLVRSQLRRHQRAEGLPDLDVEALEAMVRALDSTDETQVREAMAMLLEDGKADLIPNLILYHPSDDVVTDALSIFARTGRRGALEVVERVARERSCQVRSAALRCAHDLGAKVDFDRLYVDNESWFVKATSLAAIATNRALSGPEHEQLYRTTSNQDERLLVSFARDIATFNSESLAPYLEMLCGHESEPVRSAAIAAIDVERFESHDRLLLNALADERTRNQAYEIVRSGSERTADLLIGSLEDPMLRVQQRRYLPSAVSRLSDPERAVTALAAQLNGESDGLLRYWLVRSIERVLTRHPEADPDLSWTDAEIDGTIARAYRYLSRASVLAAGSVAAGELPGHRMLVRLLRDKHTQSVGRVFLMLDIKDRRESFVSIWNSLRGRNEQMRDAALEMVDNVLKEPLRGAIRGLVGDYTDAERLAMGELYHKHAPRTYLDVLNELEASQSDSARELTESHRAELVHLGDDALAKLKEVVRAA